MDSHLVCPHPGARPAGLLHQNKSLNLKRHFCFIPVFFSFVQDFSTTQFWMILTTHHMQFVIRGNLHVKLEIWEMNIEYRNEYYSVQRIFYRENTFIQRLLQNLSRSCYGCTFPKRGCGHLGWLCMGGPLPRVH